MRNYTFIRKMWLKIAAVFAFVFLLCVPMTITSTSAATGHLCYCMGEMSTSQGIGQAEVDMLIANRDNPENMGLRPQSAPYMFYLKEDVSWEGEFVAPEGIVIFICLNNKELNGTCSNEGTTGGIFYIQCALHNCAEEGELTCLADQTYFDAILKMFQHQATFGQEEGEEVIVEIEMDIFFALSSDVTLGKEWVLSPNSNMTICTNGYTLTGVENMTAHGGRVEVVDCSKLHECYYFGSSAAGIGQQEVDGLLAAGNTPEAWGMPASEEPYVAYLYEDITWEGTLSAPDGVTIALCLNNHTVTGNIDNTQTENGGIYLMQCGLHACPITSETVIELSQGYVALMESIMAKQGVVVEFENNMVIALNEDITLTNPDVWAIDASQSITFCTGGHTINNIEYLRVNGASVRVIDCSNIGPHACAELGGQAEYLTRSTYNEYVDESTGLFAKTGKQILCLLGNIELPKTMVIPSGCDVTICLNGFIIYSPQFSPYKDNGIAGQEAYTAIRVMQGAKLTICDCSEDCTGAIILNTESEFTDWNGLGASAVQNMGTLVVKGGSLFGLMAVVNGGDMVVEDGGSILGLLVGVIQSGDITLEGFVCSANASVTINGGEVHSGIAGVASASGDVTLNDGEVTALGYGISSGLLEGNASGEANIYLNGGTVNAGKLNYKAYQKIGFDVKEDSDFGIEPEVCVGVMANTELVIGGDVLINVEGPGAEQAKMIADILLGDGAIISKAEGAVLENSYELSVEEENAVAIVDSSMVDHVIPSSSSTARISENGELIVVPSNDENAITARIAAYSLSLKGEIVMNLYIQAEEAFLADENARVVVLYKGEKTEYSLDQATIKDGFYVFSVDVSAKDYQKQIRCSFKDSNHVWAGATLTINQYLNTIINDTTGTYDKQKDIAMKMQNYCMAASYHFEVASEYLPSEEMQKELNDITSETLKDYAASQMGECENIMFAGVSLFLQAKTTIRFYFYLVEGATIDSITLTVNGEAAKVYQSGSVYYIEIEGIVAQDLGKMYQVNLDGMLIEYCAISYSYSILTMQTRSVSQDMIDVVKSLYAYYKAAYSYFNPTEAA